MTCCLVHYLKGVRAYQRRIRGLRELVDALDAKCRELRDRVEFERMERIAIEGTIAGLRREIQDARRVIEFLREEDRREREETGPAGTPGTTGTAETPAEPEKGGVA